MMVLILLQPDRAVWFHVHERVEVGGKLTPAKARTTGSSFAPAYPRGPVVMERQRLSAPAAAAPRTCGMLMCQRRLQACRIERTAVRLFAGAASKGGPQTPQPALPAAAFGRCEPGSAANLERGQVFLDTPCPPCRPASRLAMPLGRLVPAVGDVDYRAPAVESAAVATTPPFTRAPMGRCCASSCAERFRTTSSPPWRRSSR